MCVFLFMVLVSCIIIFNLACKLFCFWCKSKVCLVGKTALITGGVSGIGYQAALDLASKGCRVIIADVADTSEAVDAIIRATHNPQVIGKRVDLASFKSVRSLAEDINKTESRLDILANNAAIACTKKFLKTEDGIETVLQVNYYSHFLLTHLLLDLLKRSAPSRIVFTSSILAYTFAKIPLNRLNPSKEIGINFSTLETPYGVSKRCLAAAARMFGEKLKGTGVTANAYNPGGTKTSIFFRNVGWSFYGISASLLGLWVYTYGKTPEEGAQGLIQLALDDDVKDLTGIFFMEGRSVFFPMQVSDPKYCRDVWEMSIALTNLKPEEIKC